ncbi:MAG TPA: hypothetical protein VFR97_09480 [Capillimicrobium sp.]|nr:hypothetical protein [Capillimicrobium sp.]
MSDPLFLLRYLDLVVLAVALPVFIVAGWPVAGWGAAAFAWIAWRLIAHWTDRKAEATDDLKKMAGIMTASMIGRGWLVALTILAIGLGVSDEAGLAAGVLLFAVFTVSFTASFVTRPFDNHQPST